MSQVDFETRLAQVRQQAEVEIARCQIRDGFQGPYRTYIGNFVARLPFSIGLGVSPLSKYGFLDGVVDNGAYRKMSELFPAGKTHGEILGVEKLRAGGHSEEFIKCIPAELDRLVDSSLEEEGVTRGNLLSVRAEYEGRDLSDEQYAVYQERIARLVFPALTRLMAFGFNEYPDLT